MWYYSQNTMQVKNADIPTRETLQTIRSVWTTIKPLATNNRYIIIFYARYINFAIQPFLLHTYVLVLDELWIKRTGAIYGLWLNNNVRTAYRQYFPTRFVLNNKHVASCIFGYNDVEISVRTIRTTCVSRCLYQNGLGYRTHFMVRI